MDILSELIYPSVDEIASRLVQPPLVKSPGSPLFGPTGGLDSINLVSFIAIVEERVEKTTGKVVRLANDRAMSLNHNPFKTLGSLAQYVERILKNASPE